jgi:hypothetical protein
LNGTRKAEACDWWLRYIEEEVDKYLCEKGFDLHALPYDYTDTPPSNFDVVRANLALLDQIMKPDYLDLDLFMDRVTQKVYHVLSELDKEMGYILQCDWHELQLGITLTKKQKSTLQNEINYIKTLKEMDAEIIQKRQKMRELSENEHEKSETSGCGRVGLLMTDVVPICGLIMARFHILHCELETSLEIWKSGHNSSTKSWTSAGRSVRSKEQFNQILRQRCSVLAPSVCLDLAISRMRKSQVIRRRRRIFAGHRSQGGTESGEDQTNITNERDESQEDTISLNEYTF